MGDIITLKMSTSEVIEKLDKMSPAQMYSALLYISGAAETTFIAAMRMYADE